jgi:hypothetical protein
MGFLLNESRQAEARFERALDRVLVVGEHLYTYNGHVSSVSQQVFTDKNNQRVINML